LGSAQVEADIRKVIRAREWLFFASFFQKRSLPFFLARAPARALFHSG
jgi:hypothetical protein